MDSLVRHHRLVMAGIATRGFVPVEVDDEEPEVQRDEVRSADPDDLSTRHRALQWLGITRTAFDIDDDPYELDEDAAAAVDALDAFDESRRKAPLRIPKGFEGGGRFRKLSDVLFKALKDWAKGDGPDDPFKDHLSPDPVRRREQIRQVAKERGLTIRRGASYNEIASQLLDDVRKGKGGGKDEPDEKVGEKPEPAKAAPKKAPAKKAPAKADLSDDAAKAAPRKRVPAKKAAPKAAERKVQPSPQTDEARKILANVSGRFELDQLLSGRSKKHLRGIADHLGLDAPDSLTAAQLRQRISNDLKPESEATADGRFNVMRLNDLLTEMSEASVDLDPGHVKGARAGWDDVLDASPGRSSAASDASREALHDYKSDAHFREVNEALFSGRYKAGDNPIVDGVRDAMRPLDDDVVVWRGGGRGLRRRLPAGAWNRKGGLEGVEWTRHDFASTSTSEDAARDFALKEDGSEAADSQPTLMRIRVPAGTRAVAVDSVLERDGADDISQYLDEQELILGDGLKHRVVKDYGVVRGIRRLDIEVVPDRDAEQSAAPRKRVPAKKAAKKAALGVPDARVEVADAPAANDDALKAAPAQFTTGDSLGKPRGVLDAPGGPLSDDHLVALENYALGGFWNTNADLRDGRMPGEVRLIDEVLDRSALTRDVEVWRGVRTGRQIFGSRETWPDDLSGFEWTDKAYTSASTRRATGEFFGMTDDLAISNGVVLRIAVPKGTRAIGIKTEHELVLERGLHFRVVRDPGPPADKYGKRFLDVEVVPAASPDAEQSARDRQADIDSARTHADVVATFDETIASLIADDHTELDDADFGRLHRQVTQKLGSDEELRLAFAPVLKAVNDHDLRQARRQLDNILEKLGVTPYEKAGDTDRFDPKRHEAIGKISPGAAVEVIRPGYTLKRDGEDIRLSKARVEEADEPTGDAGVAKGKAALDAAPASLISGRGLTPQQKSALRHYQDQGAHDRINNALREGRDVTRMARVARIDEALASSPLTADVVVYRGLHGEGVFGSPGEWPSDLTGFEWTDAAYQSTSAQFDSAKGFGGEHQVVLEMRVPRGTPAVAMSRFERPGGIPDEAELLLDRGLHMKVTGERLVDDGGLRPRRVLTVEVTRGDGPLPAAPTADPLAALRDLDPESARDDLDLRTVPKLKPLLKAAGLPVSGKKRDLVDRLVEHLHSGDSPTAPQAPTPEKSAGDLVQNLSEEELIALQLLSAQGTFADGDWMPATKLTAMHRQHLDSLARKGIIQKHTGADGENLYRIDPRSVGAQKSANAEPGGALVGDVLPADRAPESRLSLSQIHTGAILKGYRDSGGGFGNVPETEADQSRVMRIVVQRIEPVGADGQPVRGAFNQTHRIIVGHDADTGRRVRSEPVPGGSYWSWEMNPDADAFGDIEGEFTETPIREAVAAPAPQAPKDAEPRVRPSGLPLDRKPETGDFDDLADRIGMIPQREKAERVREILADLTSSELRRLALKFDGAAMFVPGWNKTSGRRRGLKIPAELSLEEARQWLLDRLAGERQARLMGAWRSRMPTGDDIARGGRERTTDGHPDGELRTTDDNALKRYWTVGEGLKRWRFHPHPWTRLRNLLLEHVGPGRAERMASEWFHVVFGYWPGSRKGSNPVGPG